MARDGRDGRDGKPGDPGAPGLDGRAGRDGHDGQPGKSAYLIAKDAGFTGDQADFLRSLKGAEGRSAYGAAIARGFVGSEDEWIESLKGDRGEPGMPGRPGIPGNRGEKGDPGAQGIPGIMPRHMWSGTKLAFELAPGIWGDFTDLQGPQGEPGKNGITRAVATGGGGGGSSGIADAPADGTTYGRRNNAWIGVSAGGSVAWGAITGTLSDQTDLGAALAAKANTSSLAAVATSGAYADLTGRPSLAAVAISGAYSDLTGRPSLATVATTGAYSDLTGKPTLGTAAAAATTDFATAAQGTKADAAAPAASPTLTGTPLAPTAAAGTNSTQIATTAFATRSKTVTALSISAGVVTVDFSLGNYFTLALSADVTSFAASNLPASGLAQTIWIEIVQNASAAKTVSFSGLAFKWAGGVTGVVSSALSAVDELAVTTLDQGTSYKATLAKAFA